MLWDGPREWGWAGAPTNKFWARSPSRWVMLVGLFINASGACFQNPCVASYTGRLPHPEALPGGRDTQLWQMSTTGAAEEHHMFARTFEHVHFVFYLRPFACTGPHRTAPHRSALGAGSTALRQNRRTTAKLSLEDICALTSKLFRFCIPVFSPTFPRQGKRWGFSIFLLLHTGSASAGPVTTLVPQPWWPQGI
jgi:hypothetical protein